MTENEIQEIIFHSSHISLGFLEDLHLKKEFEELFFTLRFLSVYFISAFKILAGMFKDGGILTITTFLCLYKPEITPQMCGCKERWTSQ
jgi:hypothetical protein